MTIVTNQTENNYLKTKNKYYVAGWCDAKNDAQMQLWETNDSSYKDYVSGYEECKANSFAQDAL